MDERIIIKNLKNNDYEFELRAIDFDLTYIKKAKEKYKYKSFKIFNLKPEEATILKQICLSIGTDAAVSKKVLKCEIDYSNCIITTSLKNIEKICEKLKQQPFRCKEISKVIKDNINNKLNEWKIKNRVFNWEEEKYAMGILNITPDSFSDGGKYTKVEKALRKVEEMLKDGVDIIDIGAESTRPGALEVNYTEEILRLEKILKEIVKNFPQAVISLDTRHFETAKMGFENGVDILNDVSSLDFDKKMLNFLIKTKIPVILTHSSSLPINMQEKTHYKHLIDEIFLYLENKVNNLKKINIEKCIIDPGIGFGKEAYQNIEIINRISEFKSIGCPILIGLSRKNFLTKINKINNEKEKDYATNIYSAIALREGANLIRIHKTKNIKLLLNIIKSLN